MSENSLSLDQTVNLLRASGESTRLRLLVLLAESDLTVSDLTEILGQSQPRISRHLKLLSEAGMLERYQEGAWAYFRLSDQGTGAQFVKGFLKEIDMSDPHLTRDRQRLTNVREKRAAAAAEYFSENANEWDRIRSLHVDEDLVESAMLKLVGDSKVQNMLDLGTGTGRILELFADRYEKATGIDASRDMLALARSRLDSAALSRIQTRQGDIYLLPVQSEFYDLISIHQVLHFLEDPAEALSEASKALAPGGRMLIVDFAPHELDFLRDEHAHRWLGFSSDQITQWLKQVGLRLVEAQHLEADKPDMLTVSLWLAEKQ